jgi:hypothetical protein
MARMCLLIWIFTVHPCQKGVYMKERVQKMLELHENEVSSLFSTCFRSKGGVL